MIVVDPRRTSSAQWADLWLGLDVGSGRGAGQQRVAARSAPPGWRTAPSSIMPPWASREYRRSVEPFTLQRGEELTGVPRAAIRELAHAYATADRAQICWTLGITEHHNAVDNVLALINLGLLTGHVGRYGSGLNPLRGQNNVQGGGDMGAIPNKLPGFQDVEERGAARQVRGRLGLRCCRRATAGTCRSCSRRWSTAISRRCTSSARTRRSRRRTRHGRGALLGGLDHLIVQDILLTRTAQMADVVLPAAATWAEADGTVTSSERRECSGCARRWRRRARRATTWRYCATSRGAWGTTGARPPHNRLWDELRTLSP